MRLVVRSTSRYPTGSARVEFSGSNPNYTPYLMNIPAILKAAREAEFTEFNPNGPEAHYLDDHARLIFTSGRKVRANKFIQTVSQIVTANAGPHPDGDMMFVDRQEFPLTGDGKSPTVEFLTLKVSLDIEGGWQVTVKDWHNRLGLLLHMESTWRKLREAGFSPNYGTDHMVYATSRLWGVRGPERAQALRAEAEQIARLVLPHLRVRQPKKCQVEYSFGQ